MALWKNKQPVYSTTVCEVYTAILTLVLQYYFITVENRETKNNVLNDIYNYNEVVATSNLSLFTLNYTYEMVVSGF